MIFHLVAQTVATSDNFCIMTIVADCVEDCKWTPDSQYIGTTSVTTSGIICQAWSSQFPHEQGYNQDEMFPDATVEDASNYCRNPDNDPNGLWCFTTDPNTRWEYCYVPDCGQSPRSIE